MKKNIQTINKKNLTHQILVVIVIFVVNDPHLITLIEATQSASPKAITVDS